MISGKLLVHLSLTFSSQDMLDKLSPSIPILLRGTGIFHLVQLEGTGLGLFRTNLEENNITAGDISLFCAYEFC